MKTAEIRFIQKSLLSEGLRPGPVDGTLGDKTYTAVEKALKKRLASLPDDWQSWDPRRKAKGYLQMYARNVPSRSAPLMAFGVLRPTMRYVY